jgi:hypothetical protein
MIKESTKSIKCACGCGQLLKDKIIKLHYRFKFSCWYDKVHKKDAYKERKARRLLMRIKRKALN